jgi:hypothetical protein
MTILTLVGLAEVEAMEVARREGHGLVLGYKEVLHHGGPV